MATLLDSHLESSRRALFDVAVTADAGVSAGYAELTAKFKCTLLYLLVEARIMNEHDWVLEGVALGVLFVFITLPAVATVASENRFLSLLYVLSIVLTSTVIWFYLNRRVLSQRPAGITQTESSENC